MTRLLANSDSNKYVFVRLCALLCVDVGSSYMHCTLNGVYPLLGNVTTNVMHEIEFLWMLKL